MPSIVDSRRRKGTAIRRVSEFLTVILLSIATPWVPMKFVFVFGVALVAASRFDLSKKYARALAAEEALADDIASLISSQSSATATAEPLVSADVSADDISQEEGITKEKLVNAAQSFNAASNLWDTDEEKAVDSALASAMKSPSTLGRPDRSLPLLAKSS